MADSCKKRLYPTGNRLYKTRLTKKRRGLRRMIRYKKQLNSNCRHRADLFSVVKRK